MREPVWDADRFRRDLRDQWGIPCMTEARGDADGGSSLIFEVDGMTAEVSLVPVQVPRGEAVEDICGQIAEELHGKIPYQIIPDRRRAILAALAQARPGDLVALLGKGHEGYIETGGIRRPFSEQAVLEEYAREQTVK